MSSELPAWIRKLAEGLVGETPSARTAAGLVGGLVDNPGHGLPLIVRAEMPELSSVTAANRADTEVLSHLSLQLADSTVLTVGELKREFGPFRRPPAVHPGSPARIVFQKIAEGEAGSVTLSVEVDPKRDFEASGVQEIRIRFDAAD